MSPVDKNYFPNISSNGNVCWFKYSSIYQNKNYLGHFLDVNSTISRGPVEPIHRGNTFQIRVERPDEFKITWQQTNELKMIVFNIKSESGPSRWKAAFPLVWRNQIMTNWYRDCPKIFLHITLLMKFPFLPTGDLFIKSSFGGSVANASAPRVSMIMLTHRSWTAVRGAFPENMYPKTKEGMKE
jgi:hypothetical protein